MGAITRDRTTTSAPKDDAHADVAIWGGVECTVNRVGDHFFDQLERNGHAGRLDDLTMFAELGIRTLRFPILWERTAPDGLDNASWEWADRRMERLRELGIRPIVGLVHHGSGPRSTDLLDPEFAPKLAEYARAVAERYPWVEDFTPVNEPLTTARFSALYGFWYPHVRSDAAFARALLNELRATSMAMRAIREVTPSARLVQTEDLGRTHSSPTLRYQARFENHRRWLTFDLLAGRVDEAHPLWKYLCHHLQSSAPLDWMRDHPTPPDVIGVNYYLTSERYLDERLDRYPGCGVGGNRRHRYVDVEAIRVLADGIDGPERLIGEAWDRYRIPIAITEAHLGCVRVEQIRWFREVLDAARRLRSNGVDLQAVTAWAMLGTYDWHCLVTRCEGLYEPGVFDVRGGRPRPTALAAMIRAEIEGGRFEHPTLEAPGWWRRPDRLLYAPATSDREAGAERSRYETSPARLPERRIAPAHAVAIPVAMHDHRPTRHRSPVIGGVERAHDSGYDGDHDGGHNSAHDGAHGAPGHANSASLANPMSTGRANGISHGSDDAFLHDGRLDGRVSEVRPLLITGATGTLGGAFARVCRLRGVSHRLVARDDMDIADAESIARVLDEVRPWGVVNAAGYVRVDEAEHDVERCMRENADGPAMLAEACAGRGIALTTFSSDLVFDGASLEAYTEASPTAPLNVYGSSKVEAERRVLEAYPSALVVRTSAFFGPWDEHNFVTLTLRSLEHGEPVIVSSDMTVSPTYVPDLVDETLNLMIDGESGIWHLASDGATTWEELARIVAIEAGHDPALVFGRPTAELGLLARRPLFSPLASVHGALLPTLERALERYFHDRRAHLGAGIDASARVVQAQV
ncbi:MAG TPA: family 1 glycosylhydrolase [Candidatus Kapabacteria bacterium]|nr:family 1 glycosylhydrolase [Candidatus Kapabacteria bacterium]